MIARALNDIARTRFLRYPVVTITGPRQSGKTTLCRLAFPDLTYANLEDPDTREHALADPRGFLERFSDGAILDEVQRVPELLSAVQVLVDGRGTNGQFVLSGSHNFQLHGAIAQSLAGRTTVLDLLPPAYDELCAFPDAPRELDAVLLAGAYPRIHDQGIPASEFLADYVRTYVERDVRLVLNVQDLTTFQTFLRLCAGRSSHLLNRSALAGDCGVTHNTVKAWLSVLAASYLITLVAPWHRNVGKRLVKSPKLFFLDSGLLCWLLGIRSVEQLAVHPLRGAIFESWVVSEVWKARANRGVSEPFWFYRDHSGREIDVLLEFPGRTVLAEAKAGRRVGADADEGLRALAGLLRDDPHLPDEAARRVVYGGDQRLVRDGTEIVPWRDVHALEWC